MQLKITICNPKNHADEFDLIFKLHDSSIVKKWSKKLLMGISNYNIDDKERFYGFNTIEEETEKALTFINHCIDTINDDKKIIEKKLNSINDTDTLNYLHHIFETYHGLLDHQNSLFWNSLKPETKKALSNLNIAVHRVENVIYGNEKRLVVTYFGLPKDSFFTKNDFKFLERNYKFGELYINYVEIGKTIEDLYRDNDTYIEPEAFQPLQRYSADFTIFFFDTDISTHKELLKNCKTYFNKNYKFFNNLGYPNYDKNLHPGKIKLGNLIFNNKDEIINKIKDRQYVKKVTLLS